MSNTDQEHRISYKAGITRTPSDFLCQDGELAECINLTTDNEELKPIVQPAEYISAAYDKNNTAIDMPTFLYIHKFTGDRYIGYLQGSKELHWGTLEYDEEEGTYSYKDKGALQYNGTSIIYTDKVKITSIGKTLIIAEESGMHYFNWRASSYKSIVYPIPDLKFEAKLVGQDDTWFAVHSGKADGMLNTTYATLTTGECTISIKPESSQKDYNELVTGLYLENIKKIAEEKGFAKPFFIRAALEMYDGTYTNITPPILLFPGIEENTHFYLYTEGGDLTNSKGIVCATQKLHLYIRQTQPYKEYSDLIKNVVLFASNGIDLYDLNVDQPKNPTSSYIRGENVIVLDKIVGYDIRSTEPDDVGRISPSVHSETEFTPPEYDGFKCSASFRGLQRRESKSINDDIESTSIFYKIASIGLDAITSWTDIATKTTSEVTRNLTTQDRIEEEDYYSRNALVPQFIYAYNSRLNLANVSRKFYEGAGFFMPLDSEDEVYYTFDVTIKTDENDELTVRHTEFTNQKQGIYFFYPDSRASHVKIYKKGEPNKLILDADLKEHPGLNGAYYFSGVTTDTDEPEGTPLPVEEDEGRIPVIPAPVPEKLPNYIITSEVNNPFVFPKSGYNKVGTGNILAMSAVTMALSQDQFGKTDLVVFSESGIWGMEVDKTGLFQGIHPVTRDVLINPHNVIQTDGAVFFVTKKGLMVISERVQNGVQCVSEAMNGKPFNATALDGLRPQDTQGESAPAHDWHLMLTKCTDNNSFLDFIRSENCKIAYDYIESRLLMINPDWYFCYTLNIKDGTISKTILPFETLTNVVNNYPDYLLQSNIARSDEKTGTVYSFYEKPREEGIEDRQTAFLLTRPMKLGGPVEKASLRQLMNVGMWDEDYSQVSTKIYVSDDLKNWYEAISRFGTAAKYYRLALLIKMLPSERLSGTIITTQPRQTNNYR